MLNKYQSSPSLTIPPANPQGTFLKERIHYPRAQRKCETPTPLWQKNRAKSPPMGQLFSKIQLKNTKHEIEIMKNSTEMLICSEILKQ